MALAEGNSWATSQLHQAAVAGGCLSELKYASRPCRAWRGGWDITLEQRPLRPEGGYWGPPFAKLQLPAGGLTNENFPEPR